MDRTIITIQVEAWYLYFITSIILLGLFFNLMTVYYRRKAAKYSKLTKKLLSEMQENIEKEVAKEVKDKKAKK